MKFKVILSQDSLDDLFEIYSYLFFNDSKSSAINLSERLKIKCFELEHFAERGHQVPELNDFISQDFLEVNLGYYRIIYRIVKKEVHIQFILDGRRDIQKILEERIMR
ncbi:MAG: type II toxin-antitoxin system RelE/ParE family toxin [Ignavibacteriota bacterium]